MTLIIRKATLHDAISLSRICLLTADAGESAEDEHKYGELPGLLWAVPYVTLPTTWGFVLVDEMGNGSVVGYIVGTTDTRAFEKYATDQWWPVQATRYPLSLIPEAKPGDERCIKLLHDKRTVTAPSENLEFASAHMHINILKDYQRKGWGRKLVHRAVEYLQELGVEGDGMWLGLDRRNEKARRFYERVGFKPIGAADNQLGLKFADWKM